MDFKKANKIKIQLRDNFLYPPGFIDVHYGRLLNRQFCVDFNLI